MALRIEPTRVDIAIADTIARRTNPALEKGAETLTWAADEHVVCAAAAAWWLYARRQGLRQRRAADHVLLTAAATSVLPHILKNIFDQERPDRRTARGHLNGVPVSGKRYDAFPSGHAIHVGAMASAAAELPPATRNLAWSVGAVLVTTRVVLLAHWATDVVAGLAIGAATERLLRCFTGYGRDANRAGRCEPA